MNYLAVDAAGVRSEIDQLLREFPELADDEALLADMLEGETDLHKIVERALNQRQEATTVAAAIKERMSDLSARKARFERKGEAMKSLIKGLMETAALDKLQLPEATISVTKPRTSVNVLDLGELPQGYYRTKREADKPAIKSALETGEKIPGAELALSEPGLTIRTK